MPATRRPTLTGFRPPDDLLEQIREFCQNGKYSSVNMATIALVEAGLDAAAKSNDWQGVADNEGAMLAAMLAHPIFWGDKEAVARCVAKHDEYLAHAVERVREDILRQLESIKVSGEQAGRLVESVASSTAHPQVPEVLSST